MQYSEQYTDLHMLLLHTFSMASREEEKKTSILHFTFHNLCIITVFVFFKYTKILGMICDGNDISTTIRGLFQIGLLQLSNIAIMKSNTSKLLIQDFFLMQLQIDFDVV